MMLLKLVQLVDSLLLTSDADDLVHPHQLPTGQEQPRHFPIRFPGIAVLKTSTLTILSKLHSTPIS
jgi:hypothetical protein